MPNNLSDQIIKYKELVKPAKLLAVTKYSDAETIEKAYHFGLRDFGENRYQDLFEKSHHELLKDLVNVNWHFIGVLQSNKVKKLLEIPGLKYIHSLHNLKVLKIFCENIGDKNIKIFLQFNSSQENEKQGFDNFEQLCEAYEMLVSYGKEHLLAGVMTMASMRDEQWEEAAKINFKLTKNLSMQLSNRYNIDDIELSMGMSRDFEIAKEFGASWVRIGSALFK